MIGTLAKTNTLHPATVAALEPEQAREASRNALEQMYGYWEPAPPARPALNLRRIADQRCAKYGGYDALLGKLRSGTVSARALLALGDVFPRSIVPGDTPVGASTLSDRVAKAVAGIDPGSKRTRFEAVADLFHRELQIKYDAIPEHGSMLLALTENRINHGDSFTATDVLTKGYGLCQEKIALFRSMLLEAGIYSDFLVLGDPDGIASTIGTHMVMRVYLENPVDLDVDRGWCPRKTHDGAIPNGELYARAEQRCGSHGPDRTVVDDAGYSEMHESNYAFFSTVAHFRGLGEVSADTLARYTRLCDDALAHGNHLVEVAANRTLVALAELDARSKTAGTLTERVAVAKGLDATIARAAELAAMPRWQPHERVQLLGILAEATQRRGDKPEPLGHAIRAEGSRCTIPTLLHFYAAADWGAQEAALRNALGVPAPTESGWDFLHSELEALPVGTSP
ncbi:MAG: hypothetical protein AAF654_01485 [Myxococcota bacterium]